MKTEELQRLLEREEGPTLEFKSEWYKIDVDNQETQSRQRGEMIKDILALANGSANTAGEMAHLIIGADKNLVNGSRKLYDFGDVLPERKRILALISAACDPKLENIEFEIVPINDTKILLISIPPSPYLYETVHELKASKSNYNEHVVFIRRGESVDIASARERTAILQLKRIRFNELTNAPPIQLGAIVGILIAGLLSIQLATNIRDDALFRLVGFIIGCVVGGVGGAGIGYIYRQLAFIKNDWPRVTLPWRIIFVALFTALVIFFLIYIISVIVHWPKPPSM